MAVGAHIGMIGVVSEPILAATYISPPQPSLHITFTAPAFHQHLVKIARGRDRERRDRRKHKLADLKEFRNLVKCGDGAKIGVKLWSWKDTELS